jgi:hypothetical protein
MILYAVYRSSKKDETYLFVEKRDDFSRVPDALMATFGSPIFVMMLPLKEGRTLALADRDKLIKSVQSQGFYLQMPPPVENLLDVHLRAQKGPEA